MTSICEHCKEHYEPTNGATHQRFCCAVCNRRWHYLKRGRKGPRTDRIPVALVREEVVRAMNEHNLSFAARRSSIIEDRGKLTYSRVAIHLWGSRPDHHGGDTTRLKRALGLMPHSDHPKYGVGRYAKTINAELAARIVRHVGGDLHKAGL